MTQDISAKVPVGFVNYEPKTRQQREFHSSTARHKLLIGGYGGGKSYPAIHEVAFHCLENPNHHTMIMRNNWGDLYDITFKDVVDIWEPAGIIVKKIEKPNIQLELHLINGHIVQFKPLSSKRDQLKGSHLCQFYIDDPDVDKHQDTISFMMSRLRNPPGVFATRFQSIITANWEGRNWLWKTYMNGRDEGGDGTDLVTIINEDGNEARVQSGKAYWMCPTSDNKTLSPTYITDLAASHSQEWMDRFVYCKDVSRNSGLIYYEFDIKKNHMSKEDILKKPNLIRCLAVDVGGTHPTACIDMATDGMNIYVIGEWVKKDCKLSDLGEYLKQCRASGLYKRFIIDPSSAKGEQTSSSSVKRELHRQYGISFENGNNNVDLGISTIQDLILSAQGVRRVFIDTVSCPKLVKGVEIYRWEDMKNMDLDAMEFHQKPKKVKDDEVDAFRYGVMYLKKYLRGTPLTNVEHRDIKEKARLDKLKRLPYYKNNPQARDRAMVRLMYPKMGVSKDRINKIIAEI